MKIFKDFELTQEVVDKILDFGIVQAGESEKFTYYIYNETNADYAKLNFWITKIEDRETFREIKVVEFPENLESKKSAKIVFEWTASVTLKQGLRAELQIKGKERYK